MSKKRLKIAIVRKNDADQCPFGLSIPFGCKHAGGVIDNMAPTSVLGEDASEEDKAKIARANKRLMTLRLTQTAEKPCKCKYASNTIDGKDAVICNYEDTAPGVPPAPILGSPFYSRVMSGIGLDGLYTYPIGYYADYNVSRNLFYGIYSIQASKDSELMKVARNAPDTPNGACALFYCPEDSSILLLKRSSKVNKGNTWGLPGGHLEEGEFPEEGLVRELYEEIGFVPDRSDIISAGHVEMNKGSSCVIFVAAIPKESKDKWEDKIKLNWEHDGYKWFNTSEIPDNLHPVADFVLNDSANIQE